MHSYHSTFHSVNACTVLQLWQKTNLVGHVLLAEAAQQLELSATLPTPDVPVNLATPLSLPPERVVSNKIDSFKYPARTMTWLRCRLWSARRHDFSTHSIDVGLMLIRRRVLSEFDVCPTSSSTTVRYHNASYVVMGIGNISAVIIYKQWTRWLSGCSN